MFPRKMMISLVIVFIMVLGTVSVFVPEKAGGVVDSTLYVGGSGQGNYTAIQSAINAASSGDTVFVHSETYYENVVVYKTINLVGENKNTTIIDGGDVGDVVNISADWVNLRGFTLQNGNKGIYLPSSSNTITGNIITNNYLGIDLYSSGSSSNTIVGNTISNNTYGIALSGFIFTSSGNKIYHNNLISNSIHATSSISGGTNTWDNGSPSGGNYWDTYVGADANGDHIGDVPYYILGGDNLDRYPLMMPYTLTSNNQPPIANFTYSRDGRLVAFIDTSTDPDGNITSWYWDFGDQANSATSNPAHEYGERGDYAVKLTVTDDDGGTDSVTHAITVEGDNISGFEFIPLMVSFLGLLVLVRRKRNHGHM